MNRLDRSIGVLATATACLATPPAFAVQYRLVDLGIGGSAVAINNAGQITGSIGTTTTRSFIYTPGRGLFELPTLGRHVSARDINDAGEVAGTVVLAVNHGVSAFHYAPATGLTLLDAQYPALSARSTANALNNTGLVVGSQHLRPMAGSDAVPHAASFSGGRVTDLGTLGLPWQWSFANGVNDAGQIVGYSETGPTAAPLAFLYTAATGMRPLAANASPPSRANAINRHGQVAGWWDGKAFLYSAGTGMVDLGALGRGDTEALAINAAGQIVGTSTTSCGRDCLEQRAFYYSGASGMVALDSLLEGGGGWQLTEALDINDRGQIVATGIRLVGDQWVGSRSLLLTPVPEPETYALMLAGLGLLGWRLRRRH